MSKPRTKSPGPAGSQILVGKDGPQVIRSKGHRWSEAAEATSLDDLAASCNITAAAEATGFTRVAIYRRRRKDPGFAQRWEAAIDQGEVRIRALLLYRCEEALEGRVPDPDLPIPPMSVKDALAIIGHLARTRERASLAYTGIDSHEGLTHVGGYDTVVAME